MVTPTGAFTRSIESLAAALGGTDLIQAGEWAEFFVGELWVVVNAEEQVDRLRIRVYLPIDDESVVKEWVDQQPAPRSGLLQARDQARDQEEGQWRPRLLFERPAGQTDWSNDPIHDDIKQYLDAWLDDDAVTGSAGTSPPYSIADDPRRIVPASAWLLKGSEASYPTPDELEEHRAAARVGIFTPCWTTAPQTRAGDLVLFYYTAPRKAIHFVARAASDAFFSREFDVNADGPVNKAQWWAYVTTPIEIEPIPLEALREAAGGHLILKGRSGHYLRPETIARLPIRAADPRQQAELEQVAATPVGLPNLPAPANITFEVWRDLSPGAFLREEHVSSHVVEPLLRDLLEHPSLTWAPQFPIEKRVADFVILAGDKPVHVIEVKKVIRQGTQGWAACPDFTQVRWYADHLDGVPSTLIDSHRVVMIEPGADRPAREIDRRTATRADLDAIRTHLLSGYRV